MILAFASIKNGQNKFGKVTVSPSEFAEFLTQIEIDVLTSMESYKNAFHPMQFGKLQTWQTIILPYLIQMWLYLKCTE